MAAVWSRDPRTGVGEGWSRLLRNEMEVRKYIGKSLLPARPIRRSIPDKAPLLMVNFRAEYMDCSKDDIKDHYNLWCSFTEMSDVITDQIRKPPAALDNKLKTKQGRITYTRDDLIQLSGLSVSREKPRYLPDHPVVLEYPLSGLYEAGSLSAPNVPA